MATEEDRAETYRTEQQARTNGRLARWRALAGSRTAYLEALAETSPMRRDDGWEPVERLTEEENDAIN